MWSYFAMDAADAVVAAALRLCHGHYWLWSVVTISDEILVTGGWVLIRLTRLDEIRLNSMSSEPK